MKELHFAQVHLLCRLPPRPMTLFRRGREERQAQGEQPFQDSIRNNSRSHADTHDLRRFTTVHCTLSPTVPALRERIAHITFVLQLMRRLVMFSVPCLCFTLRRRRRRQYHYKVILFMKIFFVFQTVVHRLTVILTFCALDVLSSF